MSLHFTARILYDQQRRAAAARKSKTIPSDQRDLEFCRQCITDLHTDLAYCWSDSERQVLLAQINSNQRIIDKMMAEEE